MKIKFTIFVILFLMCGFGHASQIKAFTPSELSLALGELDAKKMDRFAQFYNDNVYFSDPEAQVAGKESLVSYFRQMLDVIGINKTTVNKVIRDENNLVVFWTSYIYFQGKQDEEYVYEMVSELQLDKQGLIVTRRDYFDRMVSYQHIPGFIEDAGKRLEHHITSKVSGD